MNFCFEFLQELSIVWEAISDTRKSVSSCFQTPRSWLRKTRLRLVFPTYFSVFGNWRKHSFLCLIYYYTCREYRPSTSNCTQINYWIGIAIGFGVGGDFTQCSLQASLNKEIDLLKNIPKSSQSEPFLHLSNRRYSGNALRFCSFDIYLFTIYIESDNHSLPKLPAIWFYVE